MVTYPFYAELAPMIGQKVEVLADRQYEGRLLSLHKTFAKIGTVWSEQTKEWVRTDLVWLNDILNVRSFVE